MADALFRVGDLVESRYRVTSVIGSGGMGTLYRVSDEARDSENLALKTIKLDTPSASSPESVARFQREFQVLTQLHHPNLVSVHDYGVTAEGEIYFTMEWIEGRDLEAGAQPPSPADTIPIIVQVCRALAYLHARGVIHGDLKPSNVLLTEGSESIEHRLKIVDFGVALEARSPDSRARYYTPGYSAPEVKLKRAVDHRIDLFSLGAMWYTFLMGEAPHFMLGDDRLVRFTLLEAFEERADVPVGVANIIAKLLATNPADRFASADEVIEAINAATGSRYVLETRETASSYALRVYFVDRETEVEILNTAWNEVKKGEGKLVLLSGESGVGKTRLMEELEIQSELEGARVVWGQCLQNGGSAYHPWREVLRVLIRYIEDADEETACQVGPILATILPELWERNYMAGLEPPADLDAQAAQRRLHDAITRALTSAAKLRTTVLMLEDVHWADEATLELLTFITQAPGIGGILLCASYRDNEIGPGHPLRALNGHRVQRIDVGRLAPEFTTDLARSMLGLQELPPLLTERVQRTTGGNALFVQELIRSLAVEGEVLRRTVDGWRVDRTALQRARLPEGIRQVVERRLAQLSPDAQRVLGWASAVGVLFWEGAVAEAGVVARPWVRTALREGLEQQLIIARDESAFAGEREYLFNNPTVRDVSYDALLEKDRQAIHERIAAWMRPQLDERSGEHLGLIADHLEKAGQTEQAVNYLRRAGELAAEQFANVEAVGYFSEALRLAPADNQTQRFDLLMAREEVYHIQGAREAQTGDLAALQALVDALEDGALSARQRAEVALRQGRYAEVIGDYPAAVKAAQAAIKHAQKANVVHCEAAGQLRWGYALWRQNQHEAAQDQLEQALTLARTAQVRQVEAGSLRNLGVLHSLRGDYVAAKEQFSHSIEIYRQEKDRAGEAAILNMLGIVSFKQGDYAAARVYYEQSLKISQEIGHQLAECRAVSNLGLLLHRLGDDQASREASERALVMAQALDNLAEQGFALTSLGHVLAEQGRLDEAVEVYRQALALRREAGESHMAMESLAGLARVSLAQGNRALAQAQAEEILSHLAGHALVGNYEPMWVYLTCYRVLQANDDPRAIELLNEAHELLQEQAAKFGDKEKQRVFLNGVSAHRQIVEAWNTK